MPVWDEDTFRSKEPSVPYLFPLLRSEAEGSQGHSVLQKPDRTRFIRQFTLLRGERIESTDLFEETESVQQSNRRTLPPANDPRIPEPLSQPAQIYLGHCDALP